MTNLTVDNLKDPLFKFDPNDIAPYIDELDLYDIEHQKWIKFKLWDRQRALIDLIASSTKCIILKKRQVGASQAVGADCLVRCLFSWRYSVAILSKTGNNEGGDARVFLDRIRGMYNSIPSLDELNQMFDERKPVSQFMIALVLAKAFNPCTKGKDSGVSMRFMSKSFILSLPASKGRGMTVSRIVIDEAAFVKPDPSRTTLDKVFENVNAAIEKTNGQLILISTANGLDRFASIYQDSVEGKNTFVPFFFSCYDDPTFTESKRAVIIKDYGESHADQEYPEYPEQAFIASGTPRFDKMAIAWYSKRIVHPRIVGDVQITNGRDGMIRLDKGPFESYRKRKDRGLYLISSDVAEGVRDGDYSVAKIFDRMTMEQVAEWRGHIEHRDFGTINAILGRIYNNAVIAIESNNHGHASIGRLLDTEKYPEELVFAHEVLTPERLTDDYTGHTRYGWRTTSGNRSVIINNLAQLIMDKDIPYFNQGDIKENRTFVRKKGGKIEAEETFFDDRVMANSIGYFLMTNDIFNMHYKLMRFGKYEECRRCRYFKPDIGEYGFCEKSGRLAKKTQCCLLFKQIDMTTPEVEIKSRTFKSGYVKLSA